MSDIAIRVENLGKQYRIGGKQAGSRTFRETLLISLAAPVRWMRGERKSYETFWALDDVSFEIKQGQVVGIIGRNGAGKSTLLKILSRITKPSKGRVDLYGRVASLLEVGTGFHSELSGRDNIYLNGAILGMGRREIDRKFDEIVDFSEVEKFLDTPVKYYSSGMYVRLAFAVAAHLEPEILIVDEVLAVGDVEFQKKCLGKMSDVAHEGRTVLFVSHNLGAIKNLCDTGILLERGAKKVEGEIHTVVDQYATSTSTEKKFVPFKIDEIDVMVTGISINDERNGVVVPAEPLLIEIDLEAEHDVLNVGIAVWLSHDDVNGAVFSTNTKTVKNIDVQIKKGRNRFACKIDSFNLCSGKYWLGFGISNMLVKYYYYESALQSFDVSETILKPGLLPTLPVYGHIYLDHEWIVDN